jgi:hypothetical protein
MRGISPCVLQYTCCWMSVSTKFRPHEHTWKDWKHWTAKDGNSGMPCLSCTSDVPDFTSFIWTASEPQKRFSRPATADLHVNVKWIPCHHGTARPQVADRGDGLQIWRVGADILNKQSRTVDRDGLQLVSWGGGLTTPHHKKWICC